MLFEDCINFLQKILCSPTRPFLDCEQLGNNDWYQEALTKKWFVEGRQLRKEHTKQATEGRSLAQAPTRCLEIDLPLRDAEAQTERHRPPPLRRLRKVRWHRPILWLLQLRFR